MDEFRWKTLRTKLIGSFNLKEVELPSGKRLDYLVVSYPEAVGALALTKDEQVVMVGQYRCSVDEYSWEIPIGTREGGETLEDCARRELREESGYVAGRFQHLFTFHPSNGASDQVIHLYVASEATPGKPLSSAHEPVEELMRIEVVPFQTILGRVLSNEIKDAATIIAVLMYAERRNARE